MRRTSLLASVVPAVVAFAAVPFLLSGYTAPTPAPDSIPMPAVDPPLPVPVSVLSATAADNVWSGGWRTATARGNRGRGFAIALLDPTHPDGLHVRRMHALIGETCPDVAVYRAAALPSELFRLCAPPFGCSVICCPWMYTVPVPAWDAIIKWAADNGVLVFQAAGNGVDPVLSPHSVACAAVVADGNLDRAGSPPAGRIDAVLWVGDQGSSGATARMSAIASQWLGAGGVNLYGTPDARLSGFRHWLSTGRPHPSGRGKLPRAWSL